MKLFKKNGKLKLNKDGVLIQGPSTPLPLKQKENSQGMSPEAMLAAMREIVRQEIQAIQGMPLSGKVRVVEEKVVEAITIDSSIVVTDVKIDDLEKNFESIASTEVKEDQAVASTTSKLAALKNKK